MKQVLLIYMLLFASSLVHGQEIVLVSKQEILQAVAENNNALKIGAQDILSAKGEYQQTRAVFLPNITASYTGYATTNPLMAFGSKLNQEILTQNDFDPALLNDPSQVTNFSTRIEIQQPLLNMDGLFHRKAAKAKLAASRQQLERTEAYITLEVEKAFMQLQLAYKTLEVLETAKKAAQENLRLASNSYKQGYLQKSDVLAVEVRLTEVENQLQYAQSTVENSSNYLSVLMHDTTYRIMKPSDSLVISSEIMEDASLSEERADLQAKKYVSEAYKEQYRADKMSFLPRLDAFGSYELYDSEIFQGDASGYLVGASLSWNILEGSKRLGKTQKSKAEFEKSQLEYEQYKAESEVALYSAKRMLSDAKNNLKLTQLALQQSKESLRIRTNRFKEGLERTNDLLLAETQYAQKQLEYYTTIFQYNYALAYVQFLTKN